jgi:hypothetical protein
MSGYGFGKKPTTPAKPADDTLDLTGITRAPLPLDPAREEAAMARGAALGFVERGEAGSVTGEGTVRRRRQATPQASLYIKGPKETLDWFIEFTNERGHRSYWQTIAEFREMVERDANGDPGR